MKPVTIKDLSKHLLLSTSTVSRALANDKNIRKETRELVLAAAREFGYQPNPTALNLKTGRSNSIGVIVPEMITPFASQVLEGIQEVLAAKGFRVIIAQSGEDPETERKNLLMMEQFRVDGLIICPTHQNYNNELFLQLKQNGMRMVFYDRIPGTLDVSKVVVNDYTKSLLMVEHLIRLGRKRIVHLQAPDYIYNAAERARGYTDALGKFQIGIDPDLIIKTGLSFEDGRLAIESLLRRGIPFDGIFAFTDTLAIGAMNYLREQNITIPGQVAIASFSGTKLSTIVYPPLTTVEQPLCEMGRVAAKLIFEKITDNIQTETTVTLEAALKFRASTTGS
jgi:DNA-binding LacI/PurR family transcriptional regulator